MKKLVVAIVGVVIVAALAGWWMLRQGGAEPVVMTLTAGPSQPRVSPAEAGIDPAAIEAAINYAADHGTQALIVQRGGHIVVEKYWGSVNFETPVDPGFAPVLAAMAVGAAMSDRLIRSLDLPLTHYLGDAAGEWGVLTPRVLLQPDRAGLDPAEATDLLALLLERVNKKPYEAVIAQKLWQPLRAGTLQFERAPSRARPEGVKAGCCVRARIGDWMRVGETLMRDGIFEANELMPPRFIRGLMTPAPDNSARGAILRTDGEFAAQDVVWLEGIDQQRLWVVPSLELVILRIGEAQIPSQWNEAMIPNGVIRGSSGWKPRAAPEGTDPGKFAPH